LEKKLKDITDLYYYEVTKENPIIIKLDISEKQRLFHYTSENAANNIYDNGCMWVTQWNYLDDNEELKYISKILRGAINYLIKKQDEYIENNLEQEIFLDIILIIKSIINMYEEGNIPISDGTFFLLSLTEKKNNKYLIENYSKRNGKIIEINKKGLDGLYLNEKDDCLIIEGKVIYDIEEQLKIIIEDINNIYNEINNSIILNNHKFDRIELRETIKSILYLKAINYSIFFKRNKFNEEEEYRIAILVDNNILKENIKYRYNENRINLKIPYIEVKIDRQYLKLKSVVNIK
jgi:hypothetical protein